MSRKGANYNNKKKTETMCSRAFADRPFRPSEEPVNLAPPLPPTTLNIKAFKVLLHGRYRALIYCLVLLCPFIFTTVACLQYYQSQDPVSYYSIPIVNLSTSRIAICLVGGARRFELTGPTILKHVLNVFPEADLFVHTNLDENTYKLGLLKMAPHVAEVRIRRPVKLSVTDKERKVLLAEAPATEIQGLLQYFDLVEGCVDMIGRYESEGNFTYDWIVRSRVDGYWMGPLDSKAFTRGSYVVPEGSRYGGFNDRLGIGNRSFSNVALSRLSLLPRLASAGFQDLNSESAFSAQLKVYNITVEELRLPFCVLSDRWCNYPPTWWDLPIASMGSPGPLSGAYCRPCIPKCKGKCLAKVTKEWGEWFSWTEWRHGSLELCNASQPWQDGWERIFDKVAGKAAANVRRRFKEMKTGECVREMEELKGIAYRWNGPDSTEICNLGLSHSQSKS